MQQTDKKRLHIMVLTDFSLYGDAAVSHAAAMAMIFRAELIIVPLQNKEIKPYRTAFLNALQVLKQQQLPVVQYPNTLNIKKDLYAFAEEQEVMMLILSASSKGESFFSYGSALRIVKKMRIPVLVVGKTLPRQDACQKIILTLDYLIYAKEKSLWAAYFNRFYQSEIYILSKQYKDEYLRYKLYENITYTKRLYENLSVKYQLHSVEASVGNLDLYARLFAKQIGAGLIVSMTTNYLDVGDILGGTTEKKTIKHVDEIPYLYINQRDDLYILCT
ncbi:MAG: hypothetical protein LBQ64_06540 [Bacteroidales bacterium]|jgi:hypothetical protein|nr:hypothetical protein [Bacteroidales bacterium]